MTSDEVDGGTVVASDGDEREPDAPRADHEHAIGGRVVVEPGAVRGVQRHRGRLDERADVGGHLGREHDEIAAVDDDLVGESSVAEDPEHAVAGRGTQVVAPRPAQGARTAGCVRLHRDQRAVAELSGELVPQRHRQIPRQHLQVGAADARRRDLHVHRIGRVRRRGRVHLDDRDATVPRAPHRSHERTIASRVTLMRCDHVSA
jgi:hypothetical protein